MRIFVLGLCGSLAGFLCGILTTMLLGHVSIRMIRKSIVWHWKLHYISHGFLFPVFVFGGTAILSILASDFPEEEAVFDVSFCVVGIATHIGAFWSKRTLFKELYEQRLEKERQATN